MSVRTRLGGAFALYIALLTLLSLYQVRNTRRAVASGRELAATVSRLRAAATIQPARIAQASDDARKYIGTRDTGYLDKIDRTMDAFDGELRVLDSVRLTPPERERIGALAVDWRSARSAAEHLRLAPPAGAPEAVAVLQHALDSTAAATEALGAASQEAVDRELAESDHAEKFAERVTALAASGAILLSILLSALLARSIIEPLSRLSAGTHEVSAGRFGYRLEAEGKDELAQVAREFNSMTERLDELDRMKRDFVSQVSHDLKTPLSSMQETTGALLDGVAGPLSPKQRQLVAINHDSGQRLSSMLTKLLDLSRIEAGLEPEMHILDPRQVVAGSVVRMNEPVDGAARPRVSFSTDDAASRLLVRGDADRLTQVVDNLIDNALKFSPPESQVTVRVADLAARGTAVPADRWASLRRNGGVRGAVSITVSDEGAGVPAGDKERIFARFYQTPSGRAVRSRGVGLGLTICREIVAGHGGAIWVDDNVPRGSVFHVLLPGATRVATESLEPVVAASRGRQA